MALADFEKLGAFYLGAPYDLAAQKRSDLPLLYDARDLVTHAVCVGMTGSGKTGLCVGLLEEAALDGIPALVIDPKGDLANLLLTFPSLQAADFAPWINLDDARRKGLEPAAYAEQQAELWRRGLADWGQDGARIQRLRAAAEFAVYTPGSGAGVPVSILKSFAAPPPALRADGELLRERVASTVTGLLGLLGIHGEPLQSREHILLSLLFDHAWTQGQDLDLPALIQRVQAPPVAKVGVLDLETFYPAKDRFALAMALNNLLAAPGFARWCEGAPLDVAALLYAPNGKPRVAVFSIAHLSDAERMFFVALLLNETLAWVRTQSGTTSLRALLYMDEIAGYCPPSANPPSKAPLLTLMKQARAFGLGVVLATQNPVDLDYKGLGNAGTWFIGRLQTERDKQRLLDGLEGLSGGLERGALERLLPQLGNRVFLLRNVHDDAPVLFQTRWTLSYLRGPLTRDQIAQLKAAAGAPPAAPAAYAAPVSSAAPAAGARPVLPPQVPQYFLPARDAPPGARLAYRPMLYGSAKAYVGEAELPVSHLTPIGTGPVAVEWAGAQSTALAEAELQAEPVAGASFAPLPPAASKAASYDDWSKAYADWLARSLQLELWQSKAPKLTSRPGENERDFRARLAQALREQRDAQAEKLRAKYGPKLAALQERVRKAEQAAEVQKEQATAAKTQTAISFGTTLLSAFLGRKVATTGTVGRAASAARGVSRSRKESSDVARAQDNIAAATEQLAALEAEFAAELAALDSRAHAASVPLETLQLRPKKGDVRVRAVVLAWAPYAADAAGFAVPAW